MSTALTVVGLAVLIAFGPHFRIVNVILLLPGALIGIMILFLRDEIGISAVLIEYLDKAVPVVSVLCMLGFWWLVAFTVVTRWTAQRSSKAAINSRNGVETL